MFCNLQKYNVRCQVLAKKLMFLIFQQVEKETLFENEMRKIRQERQERQVLTPDEDHLNLDLGEGLRTTTNSRAASPLMPLHKSREMHS